MRQIVRMIVRATGCTTMAQQTPSEDTDEDRRFTATLADVRDVEGWMTDAQARRLWDRAREVEPGQRIVEIGSFRGRSLIVLARAARHDVEMVAIDPHAGSDRGPQEIAADEITGQNDFERFHANLDRAGVDDRIEHLRKPSADALLDVDGSISLLYIDGAHRFGPARADIRDWGAKVEHLGTVLIHDSFSSVGVTLAILRELGGGTSFRYVGRVGSLAEYQRTTLARRTRVANAARQMAQLPWFARNVVIKALILAHLTPLTRLLGHRGGQWPF